MGIKGEKESFIPIFLLLSVEKAVKRGIMDVKSAFYTHFA